mgnify:CR=1 FL=1
MSNCQLCDKLIDERNEQEQMGYTICYLCDGLYSDEELKEKLEYKKWLNAHPVSYGKTGYELARLWKKKGF